MPPPFFFISAFLLYQDVVCFMCGAFWLLNLVIFAKLLQKQQKKYNICCKNY